MLKSEVEADTFQGSVAPHLEEIRRVAARLTGSAGKAEELVSDCLAAALAAFPTLRRRDLVGVWLLQILRRKHFDRLRRRYRERRLLEEIAASDSVNCPRIDLGDVLELLEPEERRVVEMKYFGGRTSQEIAEMLGRPAGTVRSVLFYSLRKLEAALRDKS